MAIAAPDEELLGKSKGYPMGTRDEEPSPLSKAAAEPALQYRFGGRANTIDDYLAHQRTTELLVVKDGQILAPGAVLPRSWPSRRRS